MNINVPFFKESFPQFSKFDESIQSDISNDYVFSDYNGSYTKTGNANFANFVIALMRFAENNSVRSIKQIFDDNDFVNELDDSGHTLYIIATAKYNGQTYTIKSNSTNKYHPENYVVTIEND